MISGNFSINYLFIYSIKTEVQKNIFLNLSFFLQLSFLFSNTFKLLHLLFHLLQKYKTEKKIIIFYTFHFSLF